MKHIFLVLSCTIVTQFANTQTVLINETFNTGIPANWTVRVEDNFTVDNSVIDFSNGWDTLQDPENLTDTIIGSTSFFTEAGQANRWLITPALPLGGYGNMLNWKAKVHDPSYADGYLVLVSTTDNQPSSFGDTIKIVAGESEDWITREINLSDSGYVNQTIYLAFVNNSYDKYKLYLDDIQIIINDPVAALEDLKVQLSIYPNPTTSTLTINCDVVIEKITLINSNGKEISTHTSTNLNVSELDSGVYFLRIQTSRGNVTRRFIKN